MLQGRAGRDPMSPSKLPRLQQRQLRLLEIFNVVDTRIIPIGPELPFYHSNLLKNFNTPGEFKQYSQRGSPKKWF